MGIEALLWILSVLIVVFLIFAMVFFLLAFDEMKQTHKNPIDVCNNLNPWVLPEYLAHGALTVLLVVNGEWLMVLINIPLIAYNIRRYTSRSMLGSGIYDATSILVGDESKLCSMECTIKLLFYMLCFFFYLYRMMFALLAR